MTIIAASAPQSSLQTFVWAQAGVLCLVLAACAFAPRSGQAALLLPLSGAARHNSIGWAKTHDLRLIARGRLPGSLVVLGKSPPSLFSALREGALLLAAPGLSCDTISPAARPPLS